MIYTLNLCKSVLDKQGDIYWTLIKKIDPISRLYNKVWDNTAENHSMLLEEVYTNTLIATDEYPTIHFYEKECGNSLDTPLNHLWLSRDQWDGAHGSACSADLPSLDKWSDSVIPKEQASSPYQIQCSVA